MLRTKKNCHAPAILVNKQQQKKVAKQYLYKQPDYNENDDEAEAIRALTRF